jgi:hypothetical protein
MLWDSKEALMAWIRLLEEDAPEGEEIVEEIEVLSTLRPGPESLMNSLRDRLRVDTALKHECVDRAYSLLDLTQPGSFQTFLRTQLSVLLSVFCRPGHHTLAVEDLRSRMVAALEADLRELRGRLAAPVGGRYLDATAVLYMLLGSSFGTRVLRRRWLGATDPAVASAGRYLGLTPPQGAWPALCDELARHSAVGADADRIVHDAGKLFDLHLAVLAEGSLLPEGASHV